MEALDGFVVRYRASLEGVFRASPHALLLPVLLRSPFPSLSLSLSSLLPGPLTGARLFSLAPRRPVADVLVAPLLEMLQELCEAGPGTGEAPGSDRALMLASVLSVLAGVTAAVPVAYFPGGTLRDLLAALRHIIRPGDGPDREEGPLLLLPEQSTLDEPELLRVAAIRLVTGLLAGLLGLEDGSAFRRALLEEARAGFRALSLLGVRGHLAIGGRGARREGPLSPLALASLSRPLPASSTDPLATPRTMSRTHWPGPRPRRPWNTSSTLTTISSSGTSSWPMAACRTS